VSFTFCSGHSKIGVVDSHLSNSLLKMTSYHPWILQNKMTRKMFSGTPSMCFCRLLSALFDFIAWHYIDPYIATCYEWILTRTLLTKKATHRKLFGWGFMSKKNRVGRLWFYFFLNSYVCLKNKEKKNVFQKCWKIPLKKCKKISKIQKLKKNLRIGPKI